MRKFFFWSSPSHTEILRLAFSEGVSYFLKAWDILNKCLKISYAQSIIFKNRFYTVKSHILGHCPIFSKSGFRGMPQLIGKLFFPLLRTCHFIRKRDSCYIPLTEKILEFSFLEHAFIKSKFC